MVTLEGNPQDINSRLAAIEAIIPHLATKADVADLRADLRADIERMQSSLIKWFIGTWLATITILVAILGPLLVHILSRLP